MPDTERPRISVVTSCFDAETTLDATLVSVLGADDPALEYIVIDGGSRDGSLAIARRHVDRLAVLKSEPDDGQYHGIQKGMTLATGDVMAWLNADDVYLPWTLRLVGDVFARFPAVQWIIGTPAYLNGEGICTRVSGNAGNAYPQAWVRNGWFRPELAGYLQQESMFWRRSLWERTGGLDLRYSLAADFDLWCRFAEHAELVSVGVPLAMFRQRPGVQRSVTARAAYEAEVQAICAKRARAPALWHALGSRSETARHLIRALLWKPAPVISYSQAEQCWLLTRSRRPLARVSAAELLLERSVRSAALPLTGVRVGAGPWASSND